MLLPFPTAPRRDAAQTGSAWASLVLLCCAIISVHGPDEGMLALRAPTPARDVRGGVASPACRSLQDACCCVVASIFEGRCLCVWAGTAGGRQTVRRVRVDEMILA